LTTFFKNKKTWEKNIKKRKKNVSTWPE